MDTNSFPELIARHNTNQAEIINVGRSILLGISDGNITGKPQDAIKDLQKIFYSLNNQEDWVVLFNRALSRLNREKKIIESIVKYEGILSADEVEDFFNRFFFTLFYSSVAINIFTPQIRRYGCVLTLSLSGEYGANILDSGFTNDGIFRDFLDKFNRISGHPL